MADTRDAAKFICTTDPVNNLMYGKVTAFFSVSAKLSPALTRGVHIFSARFSSPVFKPGKIVGSFLPGLFPTKKKEFYLIVLLINCSKGCT